MVIIVVALIALTAAAILFSKLSMSRGTHPPDLGWMSEQWLVQHRASSRAT
jgi:hypothetical protein